MSWPGESAGIVDLRFFVFALENCVVPEAGNVPIFSPSAKPYVAIFSG